MSNKELLKLMKFLPLDDLEKAIVEQIITEDDYDVILEKLLKIMEKKS